MSEATDKSKPNGEGRDTDTKSGELYMPPPDSQGSPAPAGGATKPAEAPLPPPPSFGRQMAQLIIIPAIIVAVAVGVALLFGKLGAPQSLDNEFLRLEQSSGGGRMALGLQDPRYQERCRAAANIATQLPEIKSDDERAKMSKRLITILSSNVTPDEDQLQVYLLLAIGMLGRDEALPVILERAASPHDNVREAVVNAIVRWPNGEKARAALPQIRAMVADKSPTTGATSAFTVGFLSQRGDESSIAALRGAMGNTETKYREVKWNAAIALARLGDEGGAKFVADVLLDRKALSQMSAGEEGAELAINMPVGMQDRVILRSLGSAEAIDHPAVWQKVRELSTQDANKAIQKVARELTIKKDEPKHSAKGE